MDIKNHNSALRRVQVDFLRTLNFSSNSNPYLKKKKHFLWKTLFIERRVGLESSESGEQQRKTALNSIRLKRLSQVHRGTIHSVAITFRYNGSDVCCCLIIAIVVQSINKIILTRERKRERDSEKKHENRVESFCVVDKVKWFLSP